MDYEESDESNDGTADDINKFREEEVKGEEEEAEEEAEEDFGDEFDDFEAGAEGDDFGQFDDGFQESEEPQQGSEKHIEPDPPSLSPFVSRFIIEDPGLQPQIIISIAV